MNAPLPVRYIRNIRSTMRRELGKSYYNSFNQTSLHWTTQFTMVDRLEEMPSSSFCSHIPDTRASGKNYMTQNTHFHRDAHIPSFCLAHADELRRYATTECQFHFVSRRLSHRVDGALPRWCRIWNGSQCTRLPAHSCQLLTRTYRRCPDNFSEHPANPHSV